MEKSSKVSKTRKGHRNDQHAQRTPVAVALGTTERPRRHQRRIIITAAESQAEIESHDGADASSSRQ